MESELGPNQFRLLRIYGPIDDRATYPELDLLGHLEVFDLDNSPEYQALSYTCLVPFWNLQIGDNDPSDSSDKEERLCKKVGIVLCDGQPVHVTIWLSRALYHLGGTIVKDWLWVDAVCIKQEDPEERSRQVQNMRKIFSSATEVPRLAWS